MRRFAAIPLLLLLVPTLHAQANKREPLTEVQHDQIAEAGVDPPARILLYVKFLNEHAETIQGLIKRAHSAARAKRMDDEIGDFTALMDELGDNLDTYASRKADLRRSLKELNEGVVRWQTLLRNLPSEPGFEVSLKESVESSNDLADQVKQVTSDQDAYFKAHPDEKNQDRWEPKGSQ